MCLRPCLPFCSSARPIVASPCGPPLTLIVQRPATLGAGFDRSSCPGRRRAVADRPSTHRQRDGNQDRDSVRRHECSPQCPCILWNQSTSAPPPCPRIAMAASTSRAAATTTMTSVRLVMAGRRWSSRAYRPAAEWRVKRRSGAVQVRLRYNGQVRVLVVEDEARLSRQLASRPRRGRLRRGLRRRRRARRLPRADRALRRGGAGPRPAEGGRAHGAAGGGARRAWRCRCWS